MWSTAQSFVPGGQGAVADIAECSVCCQGTGRLHTCPLCLLTWHRQCSVAVADGLRELPPLLRPSRSVVEWLPGRLKAKNRSSGHAVHILSTARDHLQRRL
eukprot:1135912-Alexandrium_andersonii.AAC.1